jgi:osmotically inducible protein OsmC
MARLGRVLVTANTRTVGGRDGVARSSDGRLDIRLSSPGTPGSGTTPEQLFAVAWSASFISVMKLEAKKMKLDFSADPAIEAELSLRTVRGAYRLLARLKITAPGVEPHAARRLVEATHGVCPYSVATRGNIDVALNLA